MLALFKPWQSLADIKFPLQSFHNAYTKMMAKVDKKIHNFVANTQYFYKCINSARIKGLENPQYISAAHHQEFLLNKPRQQHTIQEDHAMYKDTTTEEDIELQIKLRIYP